MPHKIRKLVVSGPRDSGKTSWARELHRIIPSNRIASITKERQFSASMINNETELVIIDDCLASICPDVDKYIRILDKYGCICPRLDKYIRIRPDVDKYIVFCLRMLKCRVMSDRCPVLQAKSFVE